MSEERVTVNKGLLDNLSDSVQALTGTAENMSIQEMSNAVGAKANEKFELIETIVLTEEVSAVERTKEPDGTDYNFKELYVDMQFPDFAKMESNIELKALNIRGLFQNDLSASYSTYSYVLSMVISKDKVSGHIPLMCCHLRLRNGLYKHFCSYGNMGEYGSRGGFVNSDMAIIPNKSINGIHIGSSTNFPVAATPTIKIYGIRA